MPLERYSFGLITTCKFDPGKFVANSLVNLFGHFLRTEHEVDTAKDVALTRVGYPGNNITPRSEANARILLRGTGQAQFTYLHHSISRSRSRNAVMFSNSAPHFPMFSPMN